MNFNAFNRFLVKIVLLYVIGLLVFMIFRVLLMTCFGSYSDLRPFLGDLFCSYIVGLRYDTIVLAYVLVLPILVALVLLFVPKKFIALESFSNRILFFYAVPVYFILLWVLIIDFYFFKFFQSHLNLLAFGIIEDDTKAVLRSVWTDYPIVRIVIALIVCFLGLRYLIMRISQLKWEITMRPLWLKVAATVIFFIFFGIGMRGSLGTFPIEKDDAIISANNFVNSLTMNGIFSLKDALADRSNFEIEIDIDKTISRYGFQSSSDAVSQYLGHSIGNMSPFAAMMDSTAPNDFLKNNPPNVVFIMMESMSNYYLDLHSPSLNLLGTLETVLPDCYLFRNFLSCRNGTIHSLEGLMVNTPLTPISQSKYMGKSLESSVALPFIKNGYETSFVTGAKLGWRNLDKYIVKQYFQHAEGSATILAKVPAASTGEWGVFDEFMFDRIMQLISNAHGKPQFVFAFSTTNHTPYELPETYKPFPVFIPDSIRKVLRCDQTIATKNLTNYQYANDCLGRFIKHIKESPLGENTIVVATGDHNSLALFDFTDSHLLQKLSVPLVMYVPEKYRKGKFDPNRFGSHKDIFPTIFNLALQNTAYLKSGNNLLTNDSSDVFYAVNDFKVGMNSKGCVIADDKPLLYRWGDGKTLIPVTDRKSPELNSLIKKTKAHAASLTVFIQNELSPIK